MYLENLWWLLVAHAFTDVVGQSERMEQNKQRQNGKTWFYWLLAHGLINGFGVYTVTGFFFLGLCETCFHMLIDFGKCEKYYSVHIDQLLHLLTKLIWALLCLPILAS